MTLNQLVNWGRWGQISDGAMFAIILYVRDDIFSSGDEYLLKHFIHLVKTILSAMD